MEDCRTNSETPDPDSDSPRASEYISREGWQQRLMRVLEVVERAVETGGVSLVLSDPGEESERHLH